MMPYHPRQSLLVREQKANQPYWLESLNPRGNRVGRTKVVLGVCDPVLRCCSAALRLRQAAENC